MRLDVLMCDLLEYIEKYPKSTRSQIKLAFSCYESQWSVVENVLDLLVKERFIECHYVVLKKVVKKAR